MAQYDQNQIDQIFQQSLGRPANEAEHQFLSRYVQQGYISPFQIGQYLQGSPEAMQTRMQGQGQQYQDLLTKNNGAILGQAADAANASFSQAGRQWSSGQGNSVMQAGQQLASQQSPAIAAFYGNNFNSLNNQYAGLGQSALARSYQLNDSDTQYSRDVDMWNRQANYNTDQLNTQNRRNQQNGIIQGAFSLASGATQAAGSAGGGKNGGGTILSGFGF